MSQPEYQRVADEIRRRISAGEYAPGDKIPSQPDLQKEFGVGRRPVVDAVELLVADGYVTTRSGSGTYVRARPRLQRVSRSWYRDARPGSPFLADMKVQAASGAWTSESKATTADAQVAERLAIQPGDGVMCTHYVFTADDDPLMRSISWEPLAITEGTPIVFPEQGLFAGQGVRDRMAAIGQDIIYASELVSSRFANDEDRELLGLPTGALATVIRRTYYTAERPVEIADIIMPADRYELMYVFPVGCEPKEQGGDSHTPIAQDQPPRGDATNMP